MKENLFKKMENINIYNPLIDGPIAGIEMTISEVLDSFRPNYTSGISQKLKELYWDKDEFYDNGIYTLMKIMTALCTFLPLYLSMTAGAGLIDGLTSTISTTLKYCKNHIKIN